MKPYFAPIGEFTAGAAAKGSMRAATHGLFQVDRVAKLSHLSCSIDNNFF
jgi:hypothetical protein